MELQQLLLVMYCCCRAMSTPHLPLVDSRHSKSHSKLPIPCAVTFHHHGSIAASEYRPMFRKLRVQGCLQKSSCFTTDWRCQFPTTAGISKILSESINWESAEFRKPGKQRSRRAGTVGADSSRHRVTDYIINFAVNNVLTLPPYIWA